MQTYGSSLEILVSNERKPKFQAMIRMKKLFLPVTVLLLFVSCLEAEEPELISSFPLGGQVGSSFETEFRGFEGAKTVVFCCHNLKGHVKNTEEGVRLEIKVSPHAELGIHSFRLISDKGVSRPLSLQIHSELPLMEIDSPHHKPDQAQPVKFPAVIDGRFSRKGELDYYLIQVTEPQELLIELITGSGLISPGSLLFNDPHLVVYAPTGSWFDPRRVRELFCKVESKIFFFPLEVQVPQSIQLPRLICRFDKPGLYLTRVGSFGQKGSPDYSYQLRIVPADLSDLTRRGKWTPRRFVHADPLDWRERDFTGKIQPDRLHQLWIRGGRVSPKEENTSDLPELAAINNRILEQVLEKEPNDLAEQGLEIGIPALIEGAIEFPGDVDHFKFKAHADQRLVFEVRTLQVPSPYFSPRLEIMDAQGKELFKNFYRYLGGDGDEWGKSLEAKTVYNFKEDGEYHFTISDLTSRNGDPGFAYQVLIRPTIPHLGTVIAKTFGAVGRSEYRLDHINLVVGEAKHLTIVSELEEGFDGEIAFAFENLPKGVEAFAVSASKPNLASQAGQVYEERLTVHLDKFRPVRLATSMLLLASTEASRSGNITDQLQTIRLTARPVVNGQPGPPIPVQDFPMMVVTQSQKE